MKRCSLLWFAGLVTLLPLQNAAAQPDVFTESGLFVSGETSEWTAMIEGATEPAEVTWQLSFNQTVINRGKQKTDRTDPGRLVIKLQFPELKAAQEMKLLLTLQIPDPATRRIGSVQFPLLILPHELFESRQNWLADQKIAVFDRPGNTVSAFESSGLPFKAIKSLENIDPDETRILVIGEGTDWKRQRVVRERLNQIILSGIHVVLLSPRRFDQPVDFGEFIEIRSGGSGLPDFMNPGAIPVSLGKHQNSRFSIDDGTEQLLIESNDQGRWSWLLLTRKTDTPTCLCVLGHPLIDGWGESPAGKYSVLRLLEFLAGTNPKIQRGDK